MVFAFVTTRYPVTLWTCCHRDRVRQPGRLWIRLAQWCYATFTPSVSPIIESSRDGVGSATSAGFGGVVLASGIRHGVVVPSGDTAAAVTRNRALATHTKTVALGFFWHLSRCLAAL